MIRVPYQPLEEYLNACYMNDRADYSGMVLTQTRIALLCGVNPTEVARWQQRGSLTVWQADRVVTRLSLHLLHIWDESDAYPEMALG